MTHIYLLGASASSPSISSRTVLQFSHFRLNGKFRISSPPISSRIVFQFSHFRLNGEFRIHFPSVGDHRIFTFHFPSSKWRIFCMISPSQSRNPSLPDLQHGENCSKSPHIMQIKKQVFFSILAHYPDQVVFTAQKIALKI